MIKCSNCKLNKEEKEFYKRTDTKRGYTSHCRDCYKEKVNSRLISENMTYSDLYRKYYINNPNKYILSQTKSSAKQRGIDFDLDIDDIIIPEYCPILKVKLDTSKTKLQNMYVPSVDRIDNSKGYIKGNIMIISRLANIMKNSATKEQLINFSSYFLKKYNLLNA